MEYDVVFEGGGAKGIAFLGALAELEGRGHRINRLVGTSAGAIFVGLLAGGYDATTTREIVERRGPDGKLLLAGFMDPPASFSDEDIDGSEMMRYLDELDLPLLGEATERRLARAVLTGLLRIERFRQIFLFLEQGGFFEGDVFLNWFRAALDELEPGRGDASFAQLYARTDRDASLVASDLSDKRMLVLNHRTAPDLPVCVAVRMSMGIPMLWTDVLWRAEWGTYLGRDMTGHAIVDGGLLSNFPIHLIATDLAEVVEVMGDEDPRRVPNLGFLIDEDLADPTFDPPPPPPKHFQSAAARVARLVQTTVGARDRFVIERCLQNREVCRLPGKGYGTTEFDMTQRRFDLLLEAGRRAAAAWFDAQR